MTTSFRLFTVRGIEVGVNWSWLVVFALIVWTLATGILPAQNPGLSDGAYLVMALVTAALFFASLLGHEVGHAVQAQREGMTIDGITLWLFGGVARFRGMFPSAGAEFRIAIAGPIVSLALGLLFSLVAWRVERPAGVDAVAAWLGYTNLVLLVFNLLPALPLDGGRVLRAALWRAKGDFAWATSFATALGRGFGYLMIAGGLLLFIFEGAVSGAWLTFIGWFLLLAASAEQQYVAAREALGDLRVRDLMTRDPVCVRADASLGEVVDLVAVRRHTTYPVVDNGRVVGLLPFSCVAEVPRREWDRRRVRDCMLPIERLPRLREDEPAVEALVKLSEEPDGRGLVLDGPHLRGVLSLSDLARVLKAPVGEGRKRGVRP